MADTGEAGWAGGYPVDRSYAPNLQPDLAPDHLDLVTLACGRLPPAAGGRFRYLELGCGFGVGLAALAAVNPHGHFAGLDFLPEHIASASRLRDEAGLGNLDLVETDFESFAAEDGPRFDYIVLHGVFTWISPRNRAAVVEILRRRVAPGGLVYVGCNAMPAWAALAPGRRILRDMLAAGRGEPAAVRATLARWIETDGSAAARAFWSRMEGLPDAYLLHEFGAEHGDALWSVELDAAMAPAKLSRVGSTRLQHTMDALRFDEAQRERLKAAEAEGWGTTARDLLANASFHHAVFARGAPRASEAQTARLLGARLVAAAPPPPPDRPRRRPLSGGIEEALAAALGGGRRAVAALADELAARIGLTPRKALQAIILALATERLVSLRDDAATHAAADGAERFNAVARRRLEEGAPLPGLASARLGGAVAVPRRWQAMVLGMEPPDAEALAALGPLGLLEPH
ncbi:methyltransferase [Falsiroseomonas sp.]|uniref:methyltransferase n=1 Tax=Falsiroseomonas sp. TaxID=2870721 RepID=UPI003561E26F